MIPAAHTRLQTDIGMPQLAPGGLSETWLLKTCGHQHWRLLAEVLGLPTPDFRTATGSRLYAAFTAVRLQDGQLERAPEHAILTLDSEIERVSRTQFRSQHTLSIDGSPRGTVEMLSVFVRRAQEGVNQSVERAIPTGRPCPVPSPATGDALAALAQDFRKGRWAQAHGLRREDGAVIAAHLIEPCPHTDFNGADFLYFASFQAFLDRAEWAWFGQPTLLARSHRRDIFFYGNIEVGESVRLTLKAATTGLGRLTHWVELTEPISGRRLADALSVRDGMAASPCQVRAA